MQYLADSTEEIQSWKRAFLVNQEQSWNLPLWAEAELLTSPVQTGTSTIEADLQFMDTEIGSYKSILLHPDGSTYEEITQSARVGNTITTLSPVTNSYPLGSKLVPIKSVKLKGTPGYSAAANNVAGVDYKCVASTHNEIQAKGATPLPTYLGKVLLTNWPLSLNNKDVFAQTIDKLDHGHSLRYSSRQNWANIVTSKTFLAKTREDRQYWKLFMNSVRGRQKQFYCSTHRPDLTLLTAPPSGATSLSVVSSSNTGSPKGDLSKDDLAIYKQDGSVQYVSLDTSTNNLDGSTTVTFSPALTTPGIKMVSFLEKVRLASDTVTVGYRQAHREIKLSVQSIQS